MIERCKIFGLREPKFSIDDSFVCTIYRKKSIALEQVKDEKTTEKILRLINENPYITNQVLAAECGITIDGVFWQIRKLKQKGILVRIGADKGGFWKIIKDE